MTQTRFRFALFSTLFITTLCPAFTVAWAQLNPLSLPHATLAADISSADTALNVDSTSGFPSSGELAIDTEVLSYSSLTPTSFAISGRAQASTTASSHSAGAVVTFFPVNAGLLTASIDSAATSLNLNSTSTFPPSTGSVLIDQEIIAYAGGTTTTLTSLTRASQGTTAASHNAGAVIVGRAIFPSGVTYYIPRFLSPFDNFSGLGLANLSDGPANISLITFNSDGSSLTVAAADGTTSTISKTLTLKAHQQFSGGIFDVFGDLGGATDFYATFSSGNPDALGVVPIGNVDPDMGLNRLELAPISTQMQTDLVIPIALQNSAQYAFPVSLEIGILAQASPAEVTADFVDATGNVVQSTTFTPTASQRLVDKLTDLFSDLEGQTIDSGYVHLTSTTGFIAYEIISVGKENAYFEAFPRSNAAPAMNIPVAISGGPYHTRLVLTDGTAAVSGETPVGTVSARITAYRSDGSLLSGTGITNPVQVSFPVSGQYSKFITDVFGLATYEPFFGYLKVEVTPGSSSSGIIVSALLLRDTNNGLTAVPGQILPRTKLFLTPALFDPLIMTGLALVNPNSVAVQASVQIFNGNGTLGEITSVSVPSQGQMAAVLSSLFPDIGIASDGYLSITSPLPLFGVIAFDNGNFLATGFPVQLPDPLVAYPNPLGLATPVNSSVPASASTYPLTVQLPNPAPPGGVTVYFNPQNSVLISLSAKSVFIPEGQTTGTVTVIGNISGAVVIDITSPGFQPTFVVVSVQNVSDLTLSRNVAISPLNPVVQSGGSIQFTLTYDTTNQPTLVWDVAAVENGLNSTGTVTQTGLYTAPLLLPTDQPIRVAVSALSASTIYFGASTTVTVLPPPAQ
jgi:hypothetical protein